MNVLHLRTGAARFVVALASGAAAIGASPDAAAQGADPWAWRATIYGYLPSVGGSTSFPDPGGGGTSVGIDTGSVLDYLQGAFMGSLEARKGRWGIFTDLLYVNLGTSGSRATALEVGGAPLPIGAAAQLDYDLKGTIWTLGGAYRLPTAQGTTLDAVAGVRMLDIGQSLAWTLSGNVGAVPLPGRAGERHVDLTHWDAFVGLRGRTAIGTGGTWFVPYQVDVGTGGSKLVWQAMGGVGYTFGWGDVIVAWRHIDYRMKSGEAIQSLNFSGPAIAAVFGW
jgi:hypothetical protein